MSITNALGLASEQFMKMVEEKTMENEIRHICQHDEKCKNVENSTAAIEITTFDDGRNNIIRYIKGRGECEAENETNSKR